MPPRRASDEQLTLHFGAPKQDKATVQVRCRQCHKAVEVLREGEDLELHFCSPQCRRVWIEETPSFAVKLGRDARHRGADWEIQALEARRRDAFTCQICGVTEEELGRRLDVHHKIPYSQFRSNIEANKLDHLLSVCPTCHTKLEAQLRREMPLFRKA